MHHNSQEQLKSGMHHSQLVGRQETLVLRLPSIDSSPAGHDTFASEPSA